MVSSELDQDSGTESDDENLFEETEASEMSSENTSGCSVRSRPTSQTISDTLISEDQSLNSIVQEMSSHPSSSSSQRSYSSSHHPPKRVRTPRHSNPPHQYRLRTPDNARESPRLTRSSPTRDSPNPGSSSGGQRNPGMSMASDFNRSSIDFDTTEAEESLAADCDPDFTPCELPLDSKFPDSYLESAGHSSEEELETLTGAWDSRGDVCGPEKRKWSQVVRLSLTDSGSSDDEVCVLTKGSHRPVEFRTSPPLEVHKPIRSISPPPKMLTTGNPCSSGNPLLQNGSQIQNGNPLPKQCLIHLVGDKILSSNGVENGCLTVTPTLPLHSAHQHGTPDKAEGSTGAAARAVSPRKRHRHTPRPNRPSLDFEKMQQMKNRAVTQWRNGGELSLSFF